MFDQLLHHPYHPVVSTPEVFDIVLDLMEFCIRSHIWGPEYIRQRARVMCGE